MLYVVSTPIGNLKDITLRAIEILKNSDYIVCEDTRRTGILLKEYEINKPLIPFYKDNEEKSGNRIITLLKQEKQIALISDSGTPAISDPGYSLISKCIEEDIEISMAPGPSAFVMGLVLSNLPLHSFIFRGFPPHKKGKRRSFLERDADQCYTLVYYESPYRIKKFIEDALEIFGNRDAVLARELTKKFETVSRGKLSGLLNLLENTKIKGEYTVVIEGKKKY